MNLMKHGRKYVLTAVFVAISTAVMIGAYVLALQGRLTPEFVSLCTIYFPSLSAALVGYQWNNARISTAWAEAKGGVGVAVAEAYQPTVAAAATTQAGPTTMEDA